MAKRRFKPNKAKMYLGDKKVDSKWEKDLGEGVLKDCEFHCEKIPFVIHTNNKYEPDFTYGKYVIESKGRFRDSKEYGKYLHIRKALEGTGRELVFLFMNHECKMPNASVRKDGTFNTHGEWATKNKFRWFTEQTIKEIL